jgi:hypothetical protein
LTRKGGGGRAFAEIPTPPCSAAGCTRGGWVRFGDSRNLISGTGGVPTGWVRFREFGLMAHSGTFVRATMAFRARLRARENFA